MENFRRTRGLIAAALSMCAAAFTAFGDALCRMRDSLFGFAKTVAKAFSAAAPSAPPVLMVKAKQYTDRILKRETPRIEASWRMCPSV